MFWHRYLVGNFDFCKILTGQMPEGCVAMFVVCVEFETMPQHLDEFLVAIRKNAAQSHALEKRDVSNLMCVRTNKMLTLFFYMKFMMIRPRLRRIKPRRIIMNSTMPLME